MNNDELVSVPRERLIALQAAWEVLRQVGLARNDDDLGVALMPVLETLRENLQQPPLGWVTCSPDWLKAGGNCAAAPRWFSAPIGEHYHPPVDDQGDATVWPILDKPAKVGCGRFHVGVSARLVVEAAQRQYEFHVTPTKEAERIGRASQFLTDIHTKLDIDTKVGDID